MTPTRPILSPARIAAAVLSLGLLSLAACNTVEGIGEDISSGGKAVSEAGDHGQPLGLQQPKNALRKEIAKLAQSLFEVGQSDAEAA